MKKNDCYGRYDSFLASAMHTLKNTIAPINTYVEMIHSGKVDQEQMVDIAEKINVCSENATKFCTELMNIFRVRSEAIDIYTEKVSPFALLWEYTYMIEGNLKQKQIEVVNLIDPEIHLLSNKEMMVSVFMNLLSNAIKFSYPNSTVTFSGRIVEDDMYELSVSDEGVGIDEEEINLKLSDGTRYTTLGTAGETGTGLGLVLVKNIVYKNGGFIQAFNNKDKGATFVLTLPLYKEK